MLRCLAAVIVHESLQVGLKGIRLPARHVHLLLYTYTAASLRSGCLMLLVTHWPVYRVHSASCLAAQLPIPSSLSSHLMSINNHLLFSVARSCLF